MSSLITIPDDHSTVINFENLKAGITQSELTTWDNCPEKWYLSYNHMLRKKGEYKMYFIYGDGVHTTLEHFYKTGNLEVATLQFPDDVFPTGTEEAELYKWQLILNVQMERAVERFRSDFDEFKFLIIEEEFDVMFEGVRLKGKIDLLTESLDTGELCLMDHKSSGRFDQSGWNFRFQFMFYAWIAQQKDPTRKIQWFIPNGIKKPSIRLGKTETPEAFAQRLRADMINEPDKYFLRTHLEIQNQLRTFEERTLMPKINRVKLLTKGKPSAILIDSLVRQKNTEHCVKYGGASKCQFLDVCMNGWDKEGFAFSRRDNKHEELTEEE